MKALIEARVKAIAAAIGAAIGAYLLTALTTGTAATLHGLEVAAGTAALAFLGVHQAPKNKDRHRAAADAGYGLVEMCFALLLIVIALVILFHYVH